MHGDAVAVTLLLNVSTKGCHFVRLPIRCRGPLAKNCIPFKTQFLIVCDGSLSQQAKSGSLLASCGLLASNPPVYLHMPAVLDTGYEGELYIPLKDAQKLQLAEHKLLSGRTIIQR